MQENIPTINLNSIKRYSLSDWQTWLPVDPPVIYKGCELTGLVFLLYCPNHLTLMGLDKNIMHVHLRQSNDGL